MRKIHYGAFALLAALLVIPSAHSAKSGGNEALVTMIEGTAQAAAPGARAAALKKGDTLSRNSEVTVGESSRLELRFPDSTIMRLSEKSRLILNDTSCDPKTGTKQIKVNLIIGKLWANVKKLLTPDSAVEVKTVNAVAGVRGTVYRVNVEEDKSAMVRVYDGAVYVASPPHETSKPASAVSGPVPVPGPREISPPHHEVTLDEWQVIIQSMQQIIVSPQGVASPLQNFSPQDDADEWVKWNQEQDKKVSF